MNPNWIQNGLGIILCILLMTIGLWIIEEGDKLARKTWNKIFQPLNP